MSYSITVPDKPEALKAAAKFFERVSKIPKEQWSSVMRAAEAVPVSGVTVGEIIAANKSAPVITPTTPTPVPTAEDVTAGLKNVPNNIVITPTPPTGDALVPSVAPETFVPPPPDAATVFGQVPQNSAYQPETAAPPPTVDLDPRRLPWDGRIHASSHARLNNGNWRNRKRPAEYADEASWLAFINQVEGELTGAMAAPGPVAAVVAPVPVTSGTPGSHLPPAVGPVVPQSGMTGPLPPAAVTPPPAAGPITTFAQLNVAITSNAIPFDRVNAAVQQVGLQAYPLLAARPDLVPAVAAVLFP